MQLKKEKTRIYDVYREALQAPVKLASGAGYRIFYRTHSKGKEKKSAWYRSRQNADKALKLMQGKYGDKNAIMYVD